MADHRHLLPGPALTRRVVLLAVTVVVITFIGAETVSDIVHHGVSWLDIVALLIVILFATGICGALWESIRRGG